MSKYTMKWNGFLLLAAILLIIASCSKERNGNGDDDDDDETVIEANAHINEWILEYMSDYYLWNAEIPKKTNKNLAPPDYFESLKHKDDRFSWIQENFIELLESLSGVELEAGYDFTLLRLYSNSNEVIGCCNYIKPNSPAEQAGLKRGDFFLKINNQQLTMDNYSTLIDEMSSAHVLGVTVDFPNSLATKDVSLSVVKYEENPVFLDTIYHVSNKKIGYLVYNFFAQDNGNGDIIYEKELNNIFGEFKSAQIDELVLDLRYNPGGAVVTSIALSSMISNCTKTDIFGIAQYNSLLDEYFKVEEGADYNKDYFVDSLERYNNGRLVEQVPINQLGLDRLYIITSQRTASASELVINGLTPYMDIRLVGDTTVGKNVGSITIYETNPEKQKTNKWGMQPIVVKFANKNGFSDYGKGFAPDYESSEFDSIPLVALGDVNEPLLNETLNIISGTRTKSVKSRSIGLQPIASSADRMPARKNMYIDRKTFERR